MIRKKSVTEVAVDEECILKNKNKNEIAKVIPSDADIYNKKFGWTGGFFMRINNSQNVQQILKAYNKNVSKVKKTEEAKFKSDKIEISESAKDFQVAMKALSDVPEVREEKVEELKKKIADGKYQPSAQDIAKKMLNDIKTNNMG